MNETLWLSDIPPACPVCGADVYVFRIPEGEDPPPHRPPRKKLVVNVYEGDDFPYYAACGKCGFDAGVEVETLSFMSIALSRLEDVPFLANKLEETIRSIS